MIPTGVLTMAHMIAAQKMGKSGRQRKRLGVVLNIFPEP